MHHTDKIILGTVQFGLDYGINNSKGKPSERQVFEILEYAHKQGLNILDTADAYGNASEVLGSYNIKKPGRFEINTKFNGGSLNISKQLEATLNTLNVGSINVYFYHSFKDYINYPELRAQLIILKNKRKIKKIGLSIYENEEFEIACNSDLIDVIQFPFNLLDNYSKRKNLIELAKEKGKELQIRSVFLQGLFFKPITKLPVKLKPLTQYLERLNEITRKENVSIEHLALNYALQKKDIDHIIIGVDSLDQLKTNISMSQNKISDEAVESINQIKIKEPELLYPKNW